MIRTILLRGLPGGLYELFIDSQFGVDQSYESLLEKLLEAIIVTAHD